MEWELNCWIFIFLGIWDSFAGTKYWEEFLGLFSDFLSSEASIDDSMYREEFAFLTSFLGGDCC